MLGPYSSQDREDSKGTNTDCTHSTQQIVDKACIAGIPSFPFPPFPFPFPFLFFLLPFPFVFRFAFPFLFLSSFLVLALLGAFSLDWPPFRFPPPSGHKFRQT